MPEPTECDIGQLDDDDRKRRGIVRLPQSLGEAIEALEGDAVAKSWFPAPLYDAYRRFKRAEISLMEELTPAEQCQRYSDIY